MAVKDMIGPGIGFSPGSVKFIITRGLTSSAAVIVPGPYCVIGPELYVPGAVARQVYMPGAAESDVYVPGPVAREVCD